MKYPGYNFRIRYSLAESVEKFVDVYYQVKVSAVKSSPSIVTSDDLQKCYEKCASREVHPQSAGFIVIFMTWGWENGKQQLDLPPRCLYLNQESMSNTLGPNFCNFMVTLQDNL
jgi:hypothetical protein